MSSADIGAQARCILCGLGYAQVRIYHGIPHLKAETLLKEKLLIRNLIFPAHQMRWTRPDHLKHDLAKF